MAGSANANVGFADGKADATTRRVEEHVLHQASETTTQLPSGRLRQRTGGCLDAIVWAGNPPTLHRSLPFVCVSGSQPGGSLPDYADALRSGFPTMEAHQAARQDKTRRGAESGETRSSS
ncbi:hypothetical protein Cha6605_4274 [Chamaesiphon minutus PCC 6605]|uniref:Uncharacterized protein n=1 Tax=Chamaesiphon minutus (strain ATCC 27169 / PCC 6605) TaxID=1173020 RepID=K9UK71_CHAP6|nr:hypothetical protein Cha6605_4274 [Chamaesiphon minutus PCC 6605]